MSSDEECNVTHVYQQLGQIQGKLDGFLLTQARLEANDLKHNDRITILESNHKSLKSAAIAVAAVISAGITGLWNLFTYLKGTH